MRETADYPVWNGEIFLHQTERGQLRIWLVAPRVMLMDYLGYSDASFMGFIEDVWARTFDGAAEPMRVFGDTEHQTGFDHGFRTRMASWSRRAVPQSDTWCLLVKSRWVAMGIALVRTTLGEPSRHIEVTTSRERFHARLDTTIRRQRPRYELIKGEGRGASLEATSDAASDEASGRSPSSSGGDCDDR